MFDIKKLTLFTLLMMIMVVFTACNSNTNANPAGEAEDAIEYLEKANAAMNEIDSMLITFTSETLMPFIASDLIMDIENRGTIEVINMTDSFEARVEFAQDIMGSDVEYVAYFKDDMIVLTSFPEEMGVPGEGVRGSAQPETPFSLINIHLDFLEDAILDHDYDIVNEGVKLSFSLDSETLLRTVNGQLNMEDFTLDNLGEHHYHLTILLDNANLIQSIELEISFTYETEDGSFEASMRASLEVAHDGNINFEFPDHMYELLDIGPINSLPLF